MNRVEQAICRIREKRPQDESFVTLGVGCVVRHDSLAASLGWKCANLLVTSAHVLNPQQLVSNSIIAEFLVFDKKGYEVFELKPAAEFCQIVQGRVLVDSNGHATSDSSANEQLTILSVEPLDKRGFLKRMVKRSSLQTSRPIDCFDFTNYESEIEDGIFCNVIREYGSFGQEFESRTYKFKYNATRNVFLLEDFLKRDIELEEQSFPSDQILAGGIVFSKQGFYLGCLGPNAGHIVPSFVPDKIVQEEQAESEEKLEIEEQVSNEAEGVDMTSKQPPIDENENRDLQQTDSMLAADQMVKEEASNTDDTTEEKQQDISGNTELEIGDFEETKEAESNELSQDLSEDEKPVDSELLNEFSNNRNSADLEFVVSVDHDHPIEDEKQNEEATNTIESAENVIGNEDITTENDQNEETIIAESKGDNVEITNTETTSNEKENDSPANTEAVQASEDVGKQTEDELENADVGKEEGKLENTVVETAHEQDEDSASGSQLGIISDTLLVNTDIDHSETSPVNTETIDDNITTNPCDVTMETDMDRDVSKDKDEPIGLSATVLDTEKNEEEIKVSSMESSSPEVEMEKNEEEIKVNSVEVSVPEEQTEKNEVEIEPCIMQNNDTEKETAKSEVEIETAELELSESVPTDTIGTSITESPQIEDNLGIDDIGQAASEESSTQQESSSRENSDGDIDTDTRKEEVEVTASEQLSTAEENELKEKNEEEKNANIEEQKAKGIADHQSNTTEESSQIINETIGQVNQQNEVEQQDIMSTSPRDKTDISKEVDKQDKPVVPEIGEPLEPDDLLSARINENPKVLDDLAHLLDTEYQHGGVSSWHDLAELLDIPKEAYDHCLAFSKPSPTEDLMVFLSSTKPQFSIIDLKDSLRSMGRADAVHVIDRYIARGAISDSTVIQGVIEQENLDLLGELALKLDRGHHQNWKILARQLGVPSKIFRNFGSHKKQNSALLMLKYLPIFDPDLVVDSFKETCKLTGLNDVVKLLDASGVPGEDTIMDILEDTDFIDELTDQLNEEEGNVPNWKKIARTLRIPEEKFSIFEPASLNSPTKMLLQSIAQCEPDITVDELILALVAMKRHDVIEILGKHFRNSDIRSILEENNCLPPQPEPPVPEEDEKEQEDSTD